jgi:hypothetical protein
MSPPPEVDVEQSRAEHTVDLSRRLITPPDVLSESAQNTRSPPLDLIASFAITVMLDLALNRTSADNDVTVRFASTSMFPAFTVIGPLMVIAELKVIVPVSEVLPTVKP